MKKIIIGLGIALLSIFMIACSGVEETTQATQEEDLSQEFPELSEIDQILAELDALDEQLALDSSLEEIDLELE